jgi:ankyrin repeat protein
MEFEKLLAIFATHSRSEFFFHMKARDGFKLLNDQGESIFFILISELSYEEFNIFIQYSDINLKTDYGDLLSVEVLCCFSNKLQAYRRIKNLIFSGLKTGLKDFNGNTIMHHCVRHKNMRAVKLLKRVGASFLVENFGEKYPSDMAVGSDPVAQLVRQ